MKHLSPAEFVDEIEGRLPDGRRSHLSVCAACATRVADVRRTMSDVSNADIPEPSPLFWDHFSARVSDAVRGATPEPLRWWRHPAWAIACSVVLVAAVLIGVRDAHLIAPVKVASAPGITSGPVMSGDDAAWNLLTDVASTVEQDDPQAAPLALRPAEVDRAINDLSAAERQELRRLLQTEMKRSGN